MRRAHCFGLDVRVAFRSVELFTDLRPMDLTQAQLSYRFGVALVLGLFIGLQREYAYRQRWKDELLAGARTFPIIALLGAMATLVAGEFGSALVLAVTVFAVVLLLALGHFREGYARNTKLTTEMAGLVTFFTGALCYWGFLRVAAGLGVGTAVLLSMRLQTYVFARRIDKEDVYATLKFAVITIIVLPLLPTEGYGPAPFDVVVPYNVWLMVVLISGISFLGYILIQIGGAKRGLGLTGLLGGLASSTAVTLSVAERSHDAKGLNTTLGMVVLLAWTMMFVRVIVAVGVVHTPLLHTVWMPLGAVFGASLLYCGYLYTAQPTEEDEEPPSVKNPFRLGSAITFGVLYAVVLVVSNGAQSYLGDAGIYLSSVVGGLADVNAITLSMARLNGSGDLEASVATRAILIATAVNTGLKGGIVSLTGTSELRRAVVPGLVLMIGMCLGAVLLV